MEKKKGALQNWFAGHRAGFRWIKRCLLWSAAAVFAAGICFLSYTLVTAPKLDEVNVAADGFRSSVLDDEGTVILTLMGEESNRIYAGLDEIPEDLQKAVIAIEDERFYTHPGIDLQGIARAAYRNVKAGHLSEGASTITQQLIKNNVFTDWTQEQSVMDKVSRKLQEQHLALQLERRESKAWILENYLNTINFGSGTWGVKTAALRYFGKDVSDLTLSECAVLAAIPKSPSGYDPLNHPENNRDRRLLVLNKLLELGEISQEEWDEAVADNVYERIAQNRTSAERGEVYSYFEDALIYQVIEDLVSIRGCTEEEAWNLLFRGGLTVYSTQDSELQKICETEVNREDWYTSDVQVSVVLMDPYTGQVKAIVGGRGEKTGSLTLNRAVSSVRQPGSTIKVVGEYAAALERGIVTLGTVVDDAPYSYQNGDPIRNANGSYGGRTTIRKAIVNSINVVALKCFHEVGLDAVFAQLQAFGFSNLTEDDRVEALALGGTHNGVTNLELTAAYSAIANEGTYLPPSYYTKVVDREGRILLSKTQVAHQAVRSSTAVLLTEAMGSVMTEGTGVNAAFSGMALAGKSGTTSEMKDVWFVGYSPYYCCGVWGGYDDFSEQSSGSYVKSIWRAVMQQAHKGLAYQPFEGTESLVPADICTKCGELAVEGLCDVTVQGNMMQTEYFVAGTEPVESCSCHEAYTYCEESGQIAGPYCTLSGKVSRVYLVQGTDGTADAEAVAPEDDTVCQMHRSWWNVLFPEEQEGTPNRENPVPPAQDDGSRPAEKPGGHDRGWWNDWFRF